MSVIVYGPRRGLMPVTIGRMMAGVAGLQFDLELALYGPGRLLPQQERVHLVLALDADRAGGRGRRGGGGEVVAGGRCDLREDKNKRG